MLEVMGGETSAKTDSCNMTLSGPAMLRAACAAFAVGDDARNSHT